MKKSLSYQNFVLWISGKISKINIQYLWWTYILFDSFCFVFNVSNSISNSLKFDHTSVLMDARFQNIEPQNLIETLKRWQSKKKKSKTKPGTLGIRVMHKDESFHIFNWFELAAMLSWYKIANPTSICKIFK